MAIFKVTAPQIPKLHIAILVSSPVDFGWVPSMSEGCGDQLDSLLLILQNTATGRSNTSSQSPYFIENLTKTYLPGVAYGAQQSLSQSHDHLFSCFNLLFILAEPNNTGFNSYSKVADTAIFCTLGRCSFLQKELLIKLWWLFLQKQSTEYFKYLQEF